MSAIVTFAPPEPSQRTDEALLRDVAAGDADALAELFRRHHEAVHRFSARLLGPGAEAEDLAQQTFLLAWSRAASFRGGARVSSWLMGIASNLVRRQRRDESRRRAAFALLATYPEPERRSVADDLARRDLAGRLPAAIQQLPENLRVAYVLCEVEEVPGPEAARVLGVRPGTLWRRLHDARRRLFALLEET